MPHYRADLPPDAEQCPTYPEYYVSPGVAGVEQPRVYRWHARTARYCELLSRFTGENFGGYPRVMLYSAGKRKLVSVHRLVALTYLGTPPEGTEVCHSEDDPALLRDPSLYSEDGRVRLRYDTKESNRRDAGRIGTTPYYPAEARDRARGLRAEGRTIEAISSAIGASTATVGRWVNPSPRPRKAVQYRPEAVSRTLLAPAP